ncbi:glycine betaine ABC transporter substrate-binding protein [Paenibacillus aurantius]|uniref:Glycine betaine ABC transporter substrate-binding protein n=1 Tax=Paenibacillus aurantius TaxID=2918900 RepID=A0AA96LJP8_9BACL|nr:glycine betaine ABC transporter substrate-binding protein [Paenibacillus aurantius]WJH32331.1 glycine/betaine ABC transporter substrate-binding protein [Paenibacillus sp. CC-CFT747]WNQ12722.1 glycine betaine ABC transporter substrate-binding protein [Paenibacillus aurantius]
MKKWPIVGLTLAVSASLAGCSSGSSKESITIGSKNFTENILVAHMMADVIEQETDLKVERKVNLGGTNVAWKALQNNDIQLYPEYTGTIVANFYQQKTGTSEETLAKAKELLKKDKIQFTNKLGFNNTYTLAVTQETADKYKLKSFSDLVKVAGSLTLGSEFEFIDRPDGYPGLQKTYGMNFKEATGMDRGIMYRSLTDQKVDVIDAYSTDGQIKVNNLVVLKDDKSFFPPYDAGPVVRDDVLEKYPKLKDALAKLEGQVSEKDMQDLNAKVDSEGLKAEKVAEEFLKEKGILK